MGLTGVLLYADQWSRANLRHSQLLAGLMRQGVLRLVHWELLERAHDDDGRGRPLGARAGEAEGGVQLP